MRFLSAVRHPDVEAVRGAWRRYVEHQESPPQTVRAYVRRAWERSRAAGCDARLVRAHQLGAAETRALLREREPLLTVGRPFLAALSRAAGADRHAAVLADQDGRLLHVAGDALTLADEGFPRPGSLLSEALAGANGVGTPLAESAYVELVGPEHYIEGFHVFTCQGVPLRGPSGLLGVLSMSVRRLETADRVRDLLFCAAAAAECELLSRWLSDAAARADEPVLERLRQDMVQRVTLGRLSLELAARQVAVGVDAATTLRAVRQLTHKFTRQAALWRDLALGDALALPAEPLELADLVEHFAGLLETELRVAGVRLAWGRVERVRVLARRHALSRQLLGAFLSALQGAAPGSVLEIGLRADRRQARVLLSERPPGGPPRPCGSVAAPRLR